MSTQQHITILGAVFIALSALGLLAALIVLVATVGGGLLSGDARAAAITSGVGVVVALFIAALSLPGIIGGVGLLKRRSWSRILVLVLCVLNLLSFPFGTAVGAYGLWVLTRPEAHRILAR
jgi:hypothetical protein